MIRVVVQTVFVGVLVVAGALVGGCFAPSDGTADPIASATATAVSTVIPGVSASATPDVSSPSASATPDGSSSSASPTPDEGSPTVTPTPQVVVSPEPNDWWTVAQSTWEDTFEVTLEIFGASRITTQSEIRVRTRLRNVSDDESTYVRWSQYDPAVGTWIVLPSGPPPADPNVRRAVRLIQLWAEGDPTPSLDAFPAVQVETLDDGDDIEREASWDLTVRGDSPTGRVHAPDGVYKVRADFYPRGGSEIPGLPDILLEFEITLDRGIQG
ncbi:MAG: hypothetical protein F4X20_00970 [Dehalococcoidia bacterium]|nr:hypothetical protein [Dehalococcoidia bacterium]